MKAITTKYHGPTNSRGSRISATDGDKNRVSISYPHEVNGEIGHLRAARALADKMQWRGRLIGGWTGNGYAFVFADSDPSECRNDLTRDDIVKGDYATGARFVQVR